MSKPMPKMSPEDIQKFMQGSEKDREEIEKENKNLPSAGDTVGLDGGRKKRRRSRRKSRRGKKSRKSRRKRRKSRKKRKRKSRRRRRR